MLGRLLQPRGCLDSSSGARSCLGLRWVLTRAGLGWQHRVSAMAERLFSSLCLFSVCFSPSGLAAE